MNNIFSKVFKLSNKIRIGLINTIFWLVVFFAIYYGVTSSSDVFESENLYIQLTGNVVESPGSNDLFGIISSPDFETPQNTLLRDVLESIRLGTLDKHIKNIVLDLDYLNSIGSAAAEEIGKELVTFKNSGKSIYVFSSFYNRNQYYLGSFANEISLDPMGEVSIEGISVYRNYWKNVIDKFDVDVQVFRAGEFKSYVEPYLASSMSDGVKQQNLTWMTSIWNKYLSDIKNNRNFDGKSFTDYFNNRLELLTKYSGNSSMMAKNEGYVDILESRTSFFNRYDSLYYYTDYLLKAKKNNIKNDIAVVSLEGVITYSDNSPGSISAIDVESQLDSVLEDGYRGLIIRINSGGGGVFASEIIRRKIEEVNEQIPVVISMGDVCASGGYWISTASDKIFANNNTITGSIGVFGMVFGLEETLKEQFGINNDGITTTPNMEPYSLSKNMSEDNRDIFQLSVENTYKQFLELVKESRGLGLEPLQEIAEGRVWSGAGALKKGLVDSIGGYNEAKEYFGDDTQLTFIDKEQGMLNKIFSSLSYSSKFASAKIIKELTMFEKINDPKNIYVLWF